MKRIIALLFIVSIFITYSCHKDSSEILDQGVDITTQKDTTTPAIIERLNLTEAKILMLVDDKISNQEVTKLYMINRNDKVQLVDIETDTDTNFYLNNEIENVFDIDNRFLALKTYFGTNKNYIIEKNTGNAYPIDEIASINLSIFHQHGNFSSEMITSDENGFIYFLDENSNQIVRLDISDLNNITSQIASFEEDRVSQFTVDKNGNVVYEARYNGDNVLRAISFDKSEVNQLPGSANISWNYRFRGTDGYIYYEYDRISKITFNPFTVSQYANDDINSGCGYELLRVKNKSTNIAIGGCTSIAQYSNSDASVINIDYQNWNISEIIMSKSNDDYYFITYKNTNGNIILNKVDPLDHIPENLIENRYEINDFDVRNDNTVYFKALDTERLKSFIGKLNTEGEVEILSDDFKNDVVFLAISNL